MNVTITPDDSFHRVEIKTLEGVCVKFVYETTVPHPYKSGWLDRINSDEWRTKWTELIEDGKSIEFDTHFVSRQCA